MGPEGPVEAVDQAIVGGALDTESDAVVAVLALGRDGELADVCSGVLTGVAEARAEVLTAGHCLFEGVLRTPIPAERLRVRLGQDFADPRLELPVIAGIAHPRYEPSSVENAYDIALLSVSRPASARLPAPPPIATAPDALAIDEQVWLAGFGRATSGPELNSLRHAATQRLVALTPLTITHTGDSGTACSGDSGAPLVGLASGAVVGIVSFGATRCDGQTVSARLSAVWSELVAAKNQEPLSSGEPCAACADGAVRGDASCSSAHQACVLDPACALGLPCGLGETSACEATPATLPMRECLARVCAGCEDEAPMRAGAAASGPKVTPSGGFGCATSLPAGSGARPGHLLLLLNLAVTTCARRRRGARGVRG